MIIIIGDVVAVDIAIIMADIITNIKQIDYHIFNVITNIKQINYHILNIITNIITVVTIVIKIEIIHSNRTNKA